jgi:Outer membrane protein beta-barrel domain
MKKFTLLFIAVIGFQVVAEAQQLRYGFTAGLQSSKLAISGNNGLSITSNGLFGIHLGGVAEYSINDNIAIRPQFGLSLKGGRFNTLGTNFKTNLTYIDIPIHAVYKYEVGPGKIMGGVGPYFSFFMGGKSADEKLKSGTDIKGLDVGLSLMGGYELTAQNLSINLFYNPGLANIDPDNSSVKLRNSTFGLSVAYFLGEN